MNRTIARIGLACLLTAGTVAAAYAQGAPVGGAPAGGGAAIAQQPAPFDILFLRHEAGGNAYEFAIAQLAQQRATRPDVKSYATTLVSDHGAYHDALYALAAHKGVTLSDTLTAQAQARLRHLASTRNAAFDDAFLREAVRVNSEAMRDFRREASRTADPDIRAFVTRFLPVEQQHEAAARGLIGSARAGSRMPVIKPPAAAGANMPVIKPPVTSPMPVIPPPASAK